MNRTLALLFPGQGSQAVGMGKALAQQYAIAARVFAEADEALGFALSTLCFAGPEDALRLTTNAQPAILATSIAALRVLEQETAVRPAYVAGHSLGEYTALVAAGALTLVDAVRVVRERGRLMQEAVPVGIGAMAALFGLSAEEVAQVCAEAAQGEVVSPANLNGGGQVVVAGHAGAVRRALGSAGSGQPAGDAFGRLAGPRPADERQALRLPLRPDARSAAVRVLGPQKHLHEAVFLLLELLVRLGRGLERQAVAREAVHAERVAVE